MAMAIPQRTPWYIVPLRFIRAVFQIRRFPGLAMAILVFLLVIPSLFAEWIAPHDPIKGSLGARLKPPMWAPGGSTNYPLGTDKVGRDVLSRIIYRCPADSWCRSEEHTSELQSRGHVVCR